MYCINNCIMEMNINRWNNKDEKKLALSHIEKTKNIFINQHFNPKKLPLLVSVLLSSFHTYTQLNSAKQKPLDILKSPNFTLLISHMKLYDDKPIERGNNLCRSWFMLMKQGQNSDNGQKAQDIRRTKWNAQNRIQKTKTEGPDNDQSHRKAMTIARFDPYAIIKQIHEGAKVFDIYRHRLSDLNLFINNLYELFIKNCPVTASISYIEMAINQLRQVSKLIMLKMENIKIYIEKNGLMLGAGKWDHQFKKDKQNMGYYNLRQFAREIQQKIKEIQEKYTTISKQILAKEKKEKENQNMRNKKQKKFQDNLEDDKDSEEYDNLESVSEFDGTPSSSYNMSHKLSKRSILKTSRNNAISKLIQAKIKSRGQKRTSIQIITNMLETKQQYKKSRFMHRDGVNVGSGRTIEYGAKDMGNMIRKRGRKQVKIDGSDPVFESQQRTYRVKGSKKSLKNSSSNDISIDKKGVSKSKFKDCETNKASSQKDDSCIYTRKYHSYQELPYERSLSSRNGSKSKIKLSEMSSKKIKQTRSIKNFRSQSMMNARNNTRAPSSMKCIKSKEISTSLHNIIQQVIDCKKHGIKFIARSGKVITFDDLEQYQKYQQQHQKSKKLFNYHKKNQKNLKTNVITKAKQIQKYEKMHQNLFASKNQQPVVVAEPKANRTQNEIKSVRRLGIAINSHREEQKLEVEQEIKPANQSKKTVSQVTSNGGSKKFYKSNNRIRYDQKQSMDQRRRMVKMKTEDNINQYFNIPPQLKVNLQDRISLAQQFVRFHPNIECSLYKTTKKRQKQEQYIKIAQSSLENMILEVQSPPNRYASKDSEQQNLIQQKEKIMRDNLFIDQNKKIAFSKNLIKAANELKQKGMYGLDSSKLICI